MKRRISKKRDWDDSVPENWFKRFGWLRQALRHTNDFWWARCDSGPDPRYVPGRLLAKSKVRGR